jgi:FAD-dependent urate hydroxylase
MSSTDTAIIGAGPYGLSLAAHLNATGVPHQIFGKPMHAWRDFMPPGMLMRSEAFASCLHAPVRGNTVKDYCSIKGIPYQSVGMHFPLESFVDYGLWFQSNLVGHVREVEVVDLRRADGAYHLSLSDGSNLNARRVVMALGLKGFAKMPPVLMGFPEAYVSHSAIYGRLEWAANKEIVIVGGGQSALGLAALLNEVGAQVHVLVRGSSVTWNTSPNAARSALSKLLSPDAGIGQGWQSHVLSEYPFLFRMLDSKRRKKFVDNAWGPSGAWWLRDRVVQKIRLSLDSEIQRAAVEDGRVILDVKGKNGESSITADHVIAATGFKVDVRQHAFLSKDILNSLSLTAGAPELSHHFETNVRGLYVVGPASAYCFGPVMRFVYGAKYAAPKVARHIRKALNEDIKARRFAGVDTSSGDAAINPASR